MDNFAPLLEELLKYHNEKNNIFSMPGNKCGKAFVGDSLGEVFLNTMGNLDITEVGTLDNLHNPEGVIREAEELLAKTYNVDRAYFMVNGSTGGNLASIFTLFNEGDEVLIERNCHKSIYNGAILRKLKVKYIDTPVHVNLSIPIPPSIRDIDNALCSCTNVKGIILTSPNYFGISYDYSEHLKLLKSKGIKIMIDSAHGAHFITNEQFPKLLTEVADCVVVSAHKTLPALTQGAYLLVNNKDLNFDFYIRTFMTTSPSYLIMASLDYSRYYIDNYAYTEYLNLINRCNYWREKIEMLNKIKVVINNDLDENYSIDMTRYVLSLPSGYSGHKLFDYLYNSGIQCEMSYTKGVVLIFSPCNNDEEFRKLWKIIRDLDLAILREKDFIDFNYKTPQKILEPYEIINSKSIQTDLKNSLNKISKNFIIPYPPGIPLVCPGEIISNDTILTIERYLNHNRSVMGVVNHKVEIIEI